jgi:hypothetical protein
MHGTDLIQYRLTQFRWTPLDQFAGGREELTLQDRWVSDIHHRHYYYRVAFLTACSGSSSSSSRY